MKIEGFDHLVLNVEDLDTTLRFYEETLGLEALRVEEFRRGEAPFPSVRISLDGLFPAFPLHKVRGLGECGR